MARLIPEDEIPVGHENDLVAPVVSRRETIRGRKAAARYVSSYFDWDFAEARARPIDAMISVDSPFAAGL